jgi:hypothetical protein
LMFLHPIHKQETNTSTAIMTTMTTTTAQEDAPDDQIKLPDLHKSTIYRRHEARLAKSYALKDDPRPALIRVLSGLPVFSKVILPYNNASMDSSNSNTSTSALDAPIIGTYSEETLFATRNMEAVTSSSCGISSTNSATSTVKVLQAVFAAGVASGVAETLFGAHHAAKTASPFSNTTTTHPNHSRVFATVHPTTDGSLSLLMSTRSKRIIPAQPSMSTAAAARSLLLMSVASTSLLFGSQTFLQTQLNDKNESSIISTILSSGVAGALLGGVQGAMWQAPKPQLTTHSLFQSSVRMPASIVQTMTHTSISAIVLFTTFEQVQQRILVLQKQQDKNKSSSSSSWMATAGSGAIAGVASTLVTSQLSNTTTMVRLVPTLLRSAPKYALLFSGYQQLLQAVQL